MIWLRPHCFACQQIYDHISEWKWCSWGPTALLSNKSMTTHQSENDAVQAPLLCSPTNLWPGSGVKTSSTWSWTCQSGQRMITQGLAWTLECRCVVEQGVPMSLMHPDPYHCLYQCILLMSGKSTDLLDASWSLSLFVSVYPPWVWQEYRFPWCFLIPITVHVCIFKSGKSTDFLDASQT